MIKWKNKPEGNCPVQAEGYFMNHYFYFRARYEEATIEFAKNYSDYLSFKGINYFLLVETPPYKAGWLPKWKCLLLIYKGCFKFFIYKTKKWLWNSKKTLK